MSSTAKSQDKSVYSSDHLTRLQEAMQSIGLLIDSSAKIILDGKFHNVCTIENSKKKSGWYVGEVYRLGGHQFILCTYGDLKQERKEVFKSWGEKDRISEDVLTDLSSRQQEQQKKEEQYRKRRYKQAIADWSSLEETGESDYLKRKQIRGYGVRYGIKNNNPFIAIPISGIDGKLRGLQKIYDQNLPNQERNKDFTIGTQKKGGHFLIGTVSPFVPLCFAEGYATAASIHEATHYPVVVCFDAGNLQPVVEAYREKYPDQQLILCSDNDQWKDPNKNVGIKKATNAAEEFRCYLAVPDFSSCDTESNPTDFNDLHTLKGLETVKIQIEEADKPKPKSKTKENVTDVTSVTSLKSEVLPSNQDDNNDVTYATGQLSIWPNEEDRPCYRVYDDWFSLKSRGKKKRPGVYYHGLKETKDSITPFDLWICSPIHVDALTLDKNGRDFGRMLRFKDAIGKWHQWAMPMHLLKGSCEELRGELLSMGAEIDHKNRSYLQSYIQAIHPEKKLESAATVGWYGDAFVLPDQTINSDCIFYQASHIGQTEYSTQGTLEQWQANISRYCSGNPLLIFSVSAAFAGAILRKANIRGGGFHIHGPSSKGKSTGLIVASSVWGNDEDYSKTWSATANGMESIANLYNDSLLPLDEISQASHQEIGRIIYALGNGIGKQRATRTGAARPSYKWRVMVLSNGERAVESHMGEAGLTLKGGQAIRLLNIPIFGQYGAFNELHHFNNGRELSDSLQTYCSKYYGKAGIAFLEKLSKDSRNLDDLCCNYLEVFDCENLGSQEGRAAKRFALVAMAGELATEYGITGWKENEAIEAAVECFNQWHKNFGRGDMEERQTLIAIKEFIEKHGDSRFTKTDDPAKVNYRAGYWRMNTNGEKEYLFNNSGFREALKGLDVKESKATLIKKGWLQTKKGKPDQQVKIQGANNRYYIIVPKEIEQ